MSMRRLVGRDGSWWAVLMFAVLLASLLRAEQAAAPTSGNEESNTDGPTFTFPTATDHLLGMGKWSPT